MLPCNTYKYIIVCRYIETKRNVYQLCEWQLNADSSFTASDHFRFSGQNNSIVAVYNRLL